MRATWGNFGGSCALALFVFLVALPPPPPETRFPIFKTVLQQTKTGKPMDTWASSWADDCNQHHWQCPATCGVNQSLHCGCRFASLSAQWMPGSSAKGGGNWMVPAGNACANGDRVQLFKCWQCAHDAWMTCVRGWWQWISINFIFIKSRQSCVKSILPSQQSVFNVVLYTPTQKLWQYLTISAPNIPYVWARVYD